MEECLTIDIKEIFNVLNEKQDVYLEIVEDRNLIFSFIDEDEFSDLKNENLLEPFYESDEFINDYNNIISNLLNQYYNEELYYSIYVSNPLKPNTCYELFINDDEETKEYFNLNNDFEQIKEEINNINNTTTVRELIQKKKDEL